MNTDSTDTEGEIVHRQFDTDETDPNVEIAEAVAVLEGKSTDDIPPLYDCIDNMVERLYGNPPSPTAEAQIRFTYEGHRVVLDQDGAATIRKVE